jgi:outer membrane biogenesis lipoprotein LolB
MNGVTEHADRTKCRRGGIGRRLSFVFCLTCVALSTACGARRISLPSDPGSPLPNFSEIHAEVSAACRGARTLTAELGLRGSAGGRRLSGRLVAGFERPSSMRLEAVAPFGPPGFILATRSDQAVLLLPRDERVVKGQSAEAILGALTGVTLAPADLQAILTGCIVPTPKPIGGRLHTNGWASIDLEGGATMYLRQMGAWHVRAARRDGWEVDYPAWQGMFPQVIRLRSVSEPANVDLTATLSQIEVNVDVSPSAFTVDVPANAAPLSIDELRAAGPLGERP